MLREDVERVAREALFLQKHEVEFESGRVLIHGLVSFSAGVLDLSQKPLNTTQLKSRVQTFLSFVAIMPPKRSLVDGVSVVTLEELTAGARKTEHGKVSATDVIMVVKKFSRNSASNILRQLQDEERIPKLEMVIFGNLSGMSPNPKRGGNRLPEAAADAREMVQILWALPGDSSFRRNSADVVVRYLGGDPQLVSEVLANRAAQETLAREDPSHPARIFGEAVESERSVAAAKREAMEMLELEVREQELRTRLEQAQSQAKRTRIETFVYCHELNFEIQGSQMNFLQRRSMLMVKQFKPSCTSRRTFLYLKRRGGQLKTRLSHQPAALEGCEGM